LKKWIYEGEGRHSRRVPERVAEALPSASEAPIEITVEAEDPDPVEAVSVVDEDRNQERREDLFADLELGLRMCEVALAKAKTRYVLRFFETLQQELDWELMELTAMPSLLPERVEALIRGGCWIPADIMNRAKMTDESAFKKICLRLEKIGKIKWSRERKRKHGTAPELWLPSDMPDGGDFEIEKPGYRPDIEYDD